MLAMIKCPVRLRPRCAWQRLLLLTVAGGFSFIYSGWGNEPGAAAVGFAQRARQKYAAAQERFHTEPTNAVTAWEFARAAFDRAEFATNDTERATLAVQAISACRGVLASDPKSAPAHYYLGMNLGQLARTKTFGALKLVDEMEREFKTARGLDEYLDYAGPDRNLGLLYRDAPGIGSIGSRSKARQHLLRAAGLAPHYPENRLNLGESANRWRDLKTVQRELAALEDLRASARIEFSGADWEASWADWNSRLDRLRIKAKELAKPLASPHAAN
jgi:hypothetical protein